MSQATLSEQIKLLEHGAMATFLDFAAQWLTDWGAHTQAETMSSAAAIT